MKICKLKSTSLNTQCNRYLYRTEHYPSLCKGAYYDKCQYINFMCQNYNTNENVFWINRHTKLFQHTAKHR